MAASILVAYATRYDSTQQVAESLAATLQEKGLLVNLQPARQLRGLAGYAAVVLGAPLYLFHWHVEALRFLSQHRSELAERPVAIFALGPVHEPYDPNEWQDSSAQHDKDLQQFPCLTPAALGMFGGRHDPTKIRFPINVLARKAPASDLRDWNAVRD